MDIPPITDPLGRSWRQPDLKDIEIDGDHAYVSKETFDLLAEYSASMPSGVYDGKMWKRHDGAFDHEFVAKGGQPYWLLCWYGPSKDPHKCSTNFLNLHIKGAWESPDKLLLAVNMTMNATGVRTYAVSVI